MTDLLIWKVGKWKDLPADFRVAFTKIEGAIPDVVYEGGKFFKCINVQLKPPYWPEVVKVPLDSLDALVLDEGYGVTARVLGGMYV